MIKVVDCQMKLKSFSWNKLKIKYAMQLFIILIKAEHQLKFPMIKKFH